MANICDVNPAVHVDHSFSSTGKERYHRQGKGMRSIKKERERRRDEEYLSIHLELHAIRYLAANSEFVV
jgi:hypothetical protein